MYLSESEARKNSSSEPPLIPDLNKEWMEFLNESNRDRWESPSASKSYAIGVDDAHSIWKGLGEGVASTLTASGILSVLVGVSHCDFRTTWTSGCSDLIA